MPARALACILLLWVDLAAAQDKPADERTVRIDSGALQGALESGVLSFKGVPYAAPPVGSLRWRAPQPVKPWPGVRPATAYGRDCMQKPVSGEAGASGAQLGEDCLHLSLWRSVTKSRAPRPVLVWIHGGGFVNGGSSAPLFDGSGLARQGLIVVALNYRLGRLGFFMHPALSGAGESAGNYGFLDQLAALQWVRRNIAAFGGDPAQVTLAGQSAGAVSVLHHLASAASHGLFQRAIVMSGGGRTYLVPGGAVAPARAEQAGVAFAKSRGIEGSGAEALAALRALPAEKVNGDLGMAELAAGIDTYGGGPILDGKIVTGMPGDALRNRSAAKVPLIVGTTSDDLVLLQPPRDNPFSFFGADVGRAQFTYTRSAREPAEALRNVAADMTMHEPARFVAKHVSAAGQPAWLYRFAYVAESRRPEGTAEHAKELPFLFDTLNTVYGLGVTPEDRAMARLFIGLVGNFARTGNPNRKGLPSWPRYDPAHNELMMFTPEAKARAEPDPWKARLDLVERALDARRSP